MSSRTVRDTVILNRKQEDPDVYAHMAQVYSPWRDTSKVTEVVPREKWRWQTNRQKLVCRLVRYYMVVVRHLLKHCSAYGD
jgi:hypothetical protein